MNIRLTRRAAGAALAFCALAACVPPPPAVATAPFAAPTAADVRGAGLLALDSLAAAWGAAAVPGAPCDARYAAEALRARCAELEKDAAALRDGLAPLRALAAAAREDAMAEADIRWLTAVDAVLAAATGRSLPEGRAASAEFAAADARLRALLAEAAPGYGAEGFADMMNAAGPPLSAEEAAALAPLIAEAESALAAWERAAAPAGAALAEYSALIDARAGAAADAGADGESGAREE